MAATRKAQVMEPSNYIEEEINRDIEAGRVADCIHTRFPPEPNGYLHIGHVKAIFIDFGIARKYGGQCNLRFDDTNPVKEDTEYVDAIFEDIHWLGFDWEDRLHYASDYFEEMRAGKHPEGTMTLRAKIDMASPNINMRDPVLYRILFAHHHRTGDRWCIYPMYDFSHPIDDALEGITHSLCSLEYEDHRPLYDWVVRETGFANPPRQIEFARLGLTNTVMSKRYLRKLVEEGHVSGWDDPRMPTLCGLRRRGYTPTAIADFLNRIGVAKSNSIVDLNLLEHCIREEMNNEAPRAMAVLEPLKVTITNYPEGKSEDVTLENHPAQPEMGTRTVRFSRTVFIEREDFMENPPSKFFRLKPGGEVRLKGAYIIRCDEVVKDAAGNVVELRCSYDPESHSGEGQGRKVKGTLHWVDAETALPAEVRLYDILFDDSIENDDFLQRLNPDSVAVRANALVEASLAQAKPGDRWQFLRQGYYVADRDSTPGRLVFNRTVGLKDSWAKELNKAGQ